MFALAGAVTGVCLAAMLVTALIDAVTLTSNQKVACDLVNTRVLYTAQRKAAGRLVNAFMYWSHTKRRLRKAQKQQAPHVDVLATFQRLSVRHARRLFNSCDAPFQLPMSQLLRSIIPCAPSQHFYNTSSGLWWEKLANPECVACAASNAAS
jgi:hypothetical protein